MRLEPGIRTYPVATCTYAYAEQMTAADGTTELFDQYAHKIQQIKAEIAKVVIGQEEMISLMILYASLQGPYTA